jgi:transaldolase/glucose-6-phosphate isomerase
MNPLKALKEHGQVVWLDFLSRGFIVNGDLKKLIDQDGLCGVTSNPSIFEKAIDHSDAYDGEIRQRVLRGDCSVEKLYEGLAIQDIKHAADVLRPVFDTTEGRDGFVSLEVSPYLAMQTEPTIAEAKRLWSEVDRKNLMIKVPATQPGLRAIRALTADGINVNITLLFAQEVYEKVVDAFMSGLEEFAAAGGNVAKVASVASLFVSRVDTAVDRQIEQIVAKTGAPNDKARLSALRGKVAISNAKLTYQRHKHLFSGARWKKLAGKGARPQRLLWASTGTKNKAYSDVLYVEELIGPNTINTMPLATLEAFRDHGNVRDTLEVDLVAAQAVLDDLRGAGISLQQVTDELTQEGIQVFVEAAGKLLDTLAKKRAALLPDRSAAAH